jgi:hypothetical protein
MNNDDIVKAKNDAIMKAYFEKILSTPEEIQSRLDICGSCNFLDKSGICNACGCGIDIKVKKRTSDCPVGKWPALIDINEV